MSLELNALYRYADCCGIHIDCYNFSHMPSISMPDKNESYIGINPFLIHSHSEEKVMLAHELGHCSTGSFYNRYAALDIRLKHEHRADKWAIKKLVPKNELKEACKYCTNRWELSEYFGVTEDFMQKALDYYLQ